MGIVVFVVNSPVPRPPPSEHIEGLPFLSPRYAVDSRPCPQRPGRWSCNHMTVSASESFEKEFRRGFRTILREEVGPKLSAVGFEIEGLGGYSVQWNESFTFATNIRESKSNKFGDQEFRVLFSIWMMEQPDRRVRGIWLPTPNELSFGSLAELEAVGPTLLDGVLRSAVPLAVEKWGVPTQTRVSSVAAESSIADALLRGAWVIPGSAA